MKPEPEQWSPLVEPIWLLLLHPLGLPLWQVTPAGGGGEGDGGGGGGGGGELLLPPPPPTVQLPVASAWSSQ